MAKKRADKKKGKKDPSPAKSSAKSPQGERSKNAPASDSTRSKKYASGLSKSLDPKLRRLCAQAREPDRMLQDMARGIVSSAIELLEDAVPEVDAIRKRVIVALGNDEIPADLADLDLDEVSAGDLQLAAQLAFGSRHFQEAGRLIAAAPLP